MRKILIVCLLLLLIPNTAYSSDIIDTLENLGIYDSFDTENDIFPELSYADLASSIEKGQGIDILSVFGKIAEYLIKEFTVHYKLLISIVVAGFAVGVINTIKADEKGIYEASFDISYGIYASLLIYYFIKCIQPAKEMLEMLFTMIKSSMPILISLLSLSGGITSSSLISSSLMAMVEMLAYIINIIVLPLIIASVTVSVANNMSERINIGTMVNLMRQGAKWILGFCLAVYTGFYGVYGLVGSSLDNRIGKAARFAIGRGIPVVGGVVSESIETVMTAMGAVRNVAGTIGMTAICIVGLTPIIKTMIYILIFKLASVILEPISDRRIIALTTETSEAISLVMSVLIAVCLLFIGCIGILLIAGNFLI